MKERILAQRHKADTTPVSIPTLRQPKRGFGLQSSETSPQALTEVQSHTQPLSHDISRISLRPQAKLTISQPGDMYEQEADKVAQQVMQSISEPVNQQSIQRQEIPEEEELQMKSLANSITPLVQRQEIPEEEELQMKSLDNTTLQRQEVLEEEELQMKSMVQRQSNGGMTAASVDGAASI